MTKILKCQGCKPNEYQDKRYGKDMRVMNDALKPGPSWCCTVCGKKQPRS